MSALTLIITLTFAQATLNVPLLDCISNKMWHRERQHSETLFFSELLIGMWNVLPVEIKMAESISSFKEKLKSLLFFQLNNIFNQDNIGTYKLICPKCRSSNVYIVCSC